MSLVNKIEYDNLWSAFEGKLSHRFKRTSELMETVRRVGELRHALLDKDLVKAFKLVQGTKEKEKSDGAISLPSFPVVEMALIAREVDYQTLINTCMVAFSTGAVSSAAVEGGGM